MSVGHRQSSDLVLLWLWHRLAAVAMIQPLVWELPYATGVTLKNKQTQKKAKQKKENERNKGKKRKQEKGRKEEKEGGKEGGNNSSR